MTLATNPLLTTPPKEVFCIRIIFLLFKFKIIIKIETKIINILNVFNSNVNKN